MRATQTTKRTTSPVPDATYGRPGRTWQPSRTHCAAVPDAFPSGSEAAQTRTARPALCVHAVSEGSAQCCRQLRAAWTLRAYVCLSPPASSNQCTHTHMRAYTHTRPRTQTRAHTHTHTHPPCLACTPCSLHSLPRYPEACALVSFTVALRRVPRARPGA